MTTATDAALDIGVGNPNPESRRRIAAALADAGIAGQINGRDGEITPNAEVVLRRRYLSKDRDGNIIEDADGLFRRVARNLAEADAQYGASDAEREATAERFYLAMRRLELLPNSPTLMNAGRELQQLSACFVLPVEDSLDGIFNKVKETALIHKSGGGTGFAFSRLRPEGDVVGSTGGVASGPVSFIRAFDTATDVVKQGGTRRGANMGILDVTHPDILRFIRAKEDGQTLVNFNISVGVDADFMEKVKRGDTYHLVNPRTGQTAGELNAREVFSLLAEMAWKTGDPGLVFLDVINRDNPNPQLGRIESTNPCVTADTWVQTAAGARQVGEMVGILADLMIHGQAYATDARGFFPTGRKPILRLATEEGYTLRLTPDHPVRKVESNVRNGGGYIWAAAGDLAPGDEIQIHNHRGCSEWPGPHSEDEGYLAGRLMGDGAIIDDNKAMSIALPGAKDTGGGRIPVGGAVAVMERTSTAADTLPHRGDFAGWPEIAGLGLAPVNNTITPDMERASSCFYRGFLRGLFDAAGTVADDRCQGPTVHLAHNNMACLEAAQRMLLRLGIASRLHRESRKLAIANDNIVRFDRLIGFADPEKRAQLSDLLRKHLRQLPRERFTARVASAHPDGWADVFDVAVPGVNAFDANGVCVHNCGEQPLLPHESCNLASINLARMARFAGGDVAVDWERLGETVDVAVHLLDNVIDMNRYPIPEIEEMTKKTRRIGLGVMGFADLLVQLAIPYDSDDALEIAGQVMGFIQERTHQASMELALRRGAFPAWEGSVYNDPGRGLPRMMRNSAPTTIAPTGTISIIAGVSSGIEPLFALGYVRNVMDNTRLVEGNPYFEAVARREGFYSEQLIENIARTGTLEGLDVPQWVKDVFRTSHDISPEWHVRMQGAAQEYTDNAVSKTINFPASATVEDIANAYMLAYELGCKGITVYRDGSKDGQVLSTGETPPADEDEAYAPAVYATPRSRPQSIHGVTERVRTGHGNMYVTINFDENHRPFEVFGNLGKAGGCDSAQLEAISRLVSLALRSGIDSGAVLEQLRGITCCPAWDDGTLVRSGPDAVALALERHTGGPSAPPAKPVQMAFAPEALPNGNGHRHNPGRAHENGNGRAPLSGRRCPDCNGPVAYQEGCMTCHACAWTKCE